MPPSSAHQRSRLDRGQRAGRVQLEDPAGSGQRAQHGPVLLLERRFGVLPRGRRPVPAREVQMGQDLEQATALDHADHLGEIPAHHLGRRLAVQQPPGVDQLALAGQRVHRAEHPVEPGRPQHRGGAAREQVRLTCLHPGPDTQRRKQLAALGHAGQVPGHIERADPGGLVRGGSGGLDRVARPGGREIQVLGERHRGQPQLDGPGTGRGHRRLRAGVMRPLGMNVIVRQYRGASIGGIGGADGI